MPYYAVHKGRAPGVYESWAECATQVNGYSGAIFKKFSFLAEAQKFVEVGSVTNPLLVSARPHRTPSVQPSPKRIIVLDSGDWDVVHCEVHQTEDASVGVGVWWGDDSTFRNVSERCPAIDALERGYLVAVVRALETAPPGNSSLLVKTTALECIFLIEKAIEILKAQTIAEGACPTSMPLSLYLPRLLNRLRQKGRRIRFQHIDATSNSVLYTPGVQNAKELARLGALKDERRRIWGLQEENRDAIEHPQMSLASLEIEV